MSEYLIQGETMESIANAIRTKKGTSNVMTPGQMTLAIQELRCLDNKISFAIENPIVAAYLANVNYNPSDYSTTDVITYYRTQTSYRKDQPNAGQVPIKTAGHLRVFDKRGANRTDCFRWD